MSPPTFTPLASASLLRGWPPPVLDPAGPYASSVTTLAWVLFTIGVAVTLLVIISIAIALFGRPALKAKLGGTKAVWTLGIALPVVVLSGLLIWGLTLTAHLSAPIRGDEMRVRITGNMWWWDVVYLDRQHRPVLRDANELHIPVGEPVVLELESDDVIHNFWVPRLSGKLDMIPGRSNLMRIQADQPGQFGGVCAEYCGGPHALMGFVVVAHEPAVFARLMSDRERRLQSPPPSSAALARGGQLFQTAGCAACHRIAGTPFNGAAGPDLTFIGTRRSLGAGILPNNRGTLMGWIGNSQAIKPGNRMPPYPMLSARDLQALALYLEAQR